MSAANPISPKAHGAWIGAGTGQAITVAVVGLIEAYGTRGPLPMATVYAIGLVITAALAFFGAYIAPHLPDPPETPAREFRSAPVPRETPPPPGK
jgi:hypothetical protein